MSDSISTQHASSGLVRRQGSVVKHQTAEIWFSEDKLVVDSRVPLPDLTVREFARPRIIFESASYYVSEKSQSTSTPTIYRYVLTPWPKNDGAMTRTIILDEEYLSQIAADRMRTRRESLAFKTLVIFYPFLGFLWSPQKRCLNRIGFESHAISSLSTYTGFLMGFCCAVFLVIFEFGAKTFSVALAGGAVLLMVDAVARFDRLLRQLDQIPPGFYEWLLRRQRKDE